MAEAPINLGELIDATAVIVPLRAATVDEALTILADTLARVHGLDAASVGAELHAREQLGSTAVGEGVAIPHARADVTQTIGAFAVSPDGIPWDAPDGAPVRIVVALLSPREGSTHLAALANVARALVDPKLRGRLLAATNARDVHALLSSV